MAYIIGIITEEEEAQLVRRGYEIEAAPASLVEGSECADPSRFRMVWLDTGMTELLSHSKQDEVPEPGDRIVATWESSLWNTGYNQTLAVIAKDTVLDVIAVMQHGTIKFCVVRYNGCTGLVDPDYFAKVKS